MLLNLLECFVKEIAVLIEMGVGINEHEIYLTLKRPNEKPRLNSVSFSPVIYRADRLKFPPLV